MDGAKSDGRQHFAAPFSASLAPVRVSGEDSREGQMGNSRPRVQITESHHRWCSAAVQPWAFYGMRDSICHVDGSTNDMERDWKREEQIEMAG